MSPASPGVARPMLDLARTRESLRSEATRVLALHAALAGGAFGAAVVGAIACGFHREPPFPQGFAITAGGALASTAILCFLVVRYAVGGARSARVASMVAAVANGPLGASFFFGAGFVHDVLVGGRGVDLGALVAIVEGGIAFTLVSLIVSLPLGVGYAFVLGAAVDRLRGELDTVTHRGPLVALRIGSTLTLGSLVLTSLVLVLAQLPLVVVSPLLAIDARVHAMRTARFLADVRAGRAPGLALVPRGQACIADELVPLAPLRDGEEPMAVVRTDEGAPYRARPDALALVPPF